MKKCPFCAEEIQEEAIYCRYCENWLTVATSTEDEIKVCPFCGEKIQAGSKYCENCKKQLEKKPQIPEKYKINPEKQVEENKSNWDKIKSIAFLIAVFAIGLLLMFLIFPDINSEPPSEILLTGAGFFVIGGIAWVLALTGKVEFTGRGGCCYFLPLIGFIMLIFGLIRLVFS